MRTAPAPVPAVVWCAEDGRPLRLVLGGERYRVADRPTRLGTAPRVDGRPGGEGWRLTARREDGSCEVMDLAVDERGRWTVLARWS
ncbi:hypothetical protein [Microbacterium gilvum]|uniref:Nucleotidyltransferase n=1 Tax=Microbacterium gilvum TaxID=1336204 RepID=A0ABP9A3C9_9MICO